MNFHRKLRVEAVRCEQCLVARGEWCGDKSRPSLGILEREREKEREKLSSTSARNANVSDSKYRVLSLSIVLIMIFGLWLVWAAPSCCSSGLSGLTQGWMMSIDHALGK